MHPGQRYSFVFETDASPSYWNPAEPSLSKIKVTAHAIRYTGADEMVSVTTKGFIQAQLEFATGSPPLPTSRQAPAMNLLNRQPPRTTLEPMPLAPRTAAGRTMR